MRILLVSNLLPPAGDGGAEAYVGDLAAALSTDHEVAVAHGAGQLANRRVLSARIGPFRPLRPEGSRLVKSAWHLHDQWRLAVHRQVRDLLSSFRPDVVHTHSVQGISSAVFTAIGESDTPHVHTAHDLNLLCARVTMTRSSGEYCGGRCAPCLLQRNVRLRAFRASRPFLIAPSDFVRRRHEAFSAIAPERSFTIRQGAEAGKTSSPAPTDRVFTVGYLGTVARHKGIMTLLRVWERLDTNWRLVLAGSGPLEATARAAARKDPRIHVLGRVEKSEKEAFLAGIDLIVIPSEWEENAPLVAAEATVRGIPLLVSDRGGLPELPGATIFASGDAGDLATKLALLSDASVRRPIAHLLQSRKSELTWEHHVRCVTDVLRQVSGGSGH